MNENPEIFVGIDISKDTLDIGFQPPGHTGELPHDEQGISEATRRLREAEPRLVVLEATGGLETELAASLMAAGVAVVVVNPRQVRDYAKATGQLAKTDRIDALVLADFARAIRPELRPMKDALTRELDDLVTRRRQLVEMRVQESLRLGRASKVQQKSLKSHIAWLDKRIEEIDASPPGARRMTSCAAFQAWEPRPPRPCSPNCPNWAPSTAKGSPHSRASPPWPTTVANNGASGSSGAGVPRYAGCCTCRPSLLSDAIPSSTPSLNASRPPGNPLRWLSSPACTSYSAS
jgi:hypothetical protein